MDKIFIQHRFTIEENGSSFSDAIVLPIEEYNGLSQEEIETIKSQRHTNWKEIISNPPQPIAYEDMFREDLETVVVDIDAQIVSLQAQKEMISLAIPVAKTKPVIKEEVTQIIGEL